MSVRNADASRVLVIPPLEKQQRKKRTAPYCRVSSGSDDQLHSYAAQIDYYTDYISKHDDLVLVDIYADEGLTGTEMERRDDLNRLLRDCKKGKIDKVIVKSSSRLARNTVDSLRIMRDLKLMGVSVRCEKENIDTDDMSSEMLIMIWSNLAQEESMSISRNMRWSYQKRMRSGEFITTHAPYGYDLVEKKYLIPNDYSAEIVRWIFASYLNGKSAERIALSLTNKGVPSPDNHKEWRWKRIIYILKNEKYVGDTIAQKTYKTESLPHVQKTNKGEKDRFYIKNSHPPIINRSEYKKVQELLELKASRKKSSSGQYALAMKMICGNCGSSIKRRQSKSGHVSWLCRQRDRGVHLCHVQRIAEKDIYDAFMRMIARLKSHSNVILIPALEQLERLQTSLHNSDNGIVSIKSQLAELAEKAHKIAELRAKELLDDEIYLRQNNMVNAKRAELNRQLRITLDNDNVQDIIDDIEVLIQEMKEAPADMQVFDENIFERIVKTVVIDSCKRLRFRLLGGVEVIERI